MDTGLVHTKDSQRTALNLVSQVPVKVKPTRPYTSCLRPRERAYILTYFLPSCILPTCDQAHPAQVGHTALFIEVNHVTCYPTRTIVIASQEVICPWTSGASMLPLAHIETSYLILRTKKVKKILSTMAYRYNPALRGWGRRIKSLKPAWALEGGWCKPGLQNETLPKTKNKKQKHPSIR